MPSPDQTADIRDALIEQLRHQPRFGSYLGFFLRRKWPDLNMRAQFGGLRRFVREHGAGQIEFRGNSGGDDIFGIPGVPALTAPSAAAARGSSDDLRAWHAITRPGDRDIAAVNATTGEVVVVASAEQIPEGYRRIDGLTENDYREMARGFVSAFAGPNSQKLENIISTEANFWGSWLQAVGAVGVAREWRKWRLRRLEEIIKDKLVGAGVPSEETNATWSRLRAARRRRIAALESSAVQVETEMRPSVATSGEASQIRTIAHLAIDRLGDSELRDIKFPLGAIADAVDTLLKR